MFTEHTGDRARAISAPEASSEGWSQPGTGGRRLVGKIPANTLPLKADDESPRGHPAKNHKSSNLSSSPTGAGDPISVTFDSYFRSILSGWYVFCWLLTLGFCFKDASLVSPRAIAEAQARADRQSKRREIWINREKAECFGSDFSGDTNIDVSNGSVTRTLSETGSKARVNREKAECFGSSSSGDTNMGVFSSSVTRTLSETCSIDITFDINRYKNGNVGELGADDKENSFHYPFIKNFGDILNTGRQVSYRSVNQEIRRLLGDTQPYDFPLYLSEHLDRFCEWFKSCDNNDRRLVRKYLTKGCGAGDNNDAEYTPFYQLVIDKTKGRELREDPALQFYFRKIHGMDIRQFDIGSDPDALQWLQDMYVILVSITLLAYHEYEEDKLFLWQSNASAQLEDEDKVDTSSPLVTQYPEVVENFLENVSLQRVDSKEVSNVGALNKDEHYQLHLTLNRCDTEAKLNRLIDQYPDEARVYFQRVWRSIKNEQMAWKKEVIALANAKNPWDRAEDANSGGQIVANENVSKNTIADQSVNDESANVDIKRTIKEWPYDTLKVLYQCLLYVDNTFKYPEWVAKFISEETEYQGIVSTQDVIKRKFPRLGNSKAVEYANQYVVKQVSKSAQHPLPK